MAFKYERLKYISVTALAWHKYFCIHAHYCLLYRNRRGIDPLLPDSEGPPTPSRYFYFDPICSEFSGRPRCSRSYKILRQFVFPVCNKIWNQSSVYIINDMDNLIADKFGPRPPPMTISYPSQSEQSDNKIWASPSFPFTSNSRVQLGDPKMKHYVFIKCLML